MSDSLRTHGLWPTRLLSPWDFLGKNTRVGYNFLIQGIFPTQGFNQGLLHLQVDSLSLSHQGKTYYSPQDCKKDLAAEQQHGSHQMGPGRAFISQGWTFEGHTLEGASELWPLSPQARLASSSSSIPLLPCGRRSQGELSDGKTAAQE